MEVHNKSDHLLGFVELVGYLHDDPGVEGGLSVYHQPPRVMLKSDRCPAPEHDQVQQFRRLKVVHGTETLGMVNNGLKRNPFPATQMMYGP